MAILAAATGAGTVTLHNVNPRFYAALVAAAADDVRARIAFDGETVEIVAPSADHER